MGECAGMLGQLAFLFLKFAPPLGLAVYAVVVGDGPMWGALGVAELLDLAAAGQVSRDINLRQRLAVRLAKVDVGDHGKIRAKKRAH